MSPLAERIIKRIKSGGPITFDAFMDLALYDPEFGYYTSGRLTIGREGDFYTSSHLHPVFGAMIGKQILEMWELMGKPADFTIVEMGAGAGYACLDMLNYLRDTDFFKAVNYIIVELNPVMRDRQKARLASFEEKLKWVSNLQEINNIRGCIFSNELIDAFPVHLLQMDEELKELYIDFDEGRFVEKTGNLSRPEIEDYFNHHTIKLEKGYRTEINLRIRDWLDTVNRVLSDGFILTVDYGYPWWDYYSEDRNRGTLMCYYRHQLSEDPYLQIGEQDITAHVDFSAISEYGAKIGIKTVGFSSQGAVLISLGIDEEIKRLSETSKDYLFELSRIKKLIMPQGLGESHKVMVQYKGQLSPELRGFSMRNQLKNL